jgi:hypothetical protein
MTGRVRSVAAAVERERQLGFLTGASSRSRDQRVRSSLIETAKHAKSIGRGGVSGHDRPDASGHEWVLIGNDRMLALWHPVRHVARLVADSLAHGCV